MTEHYDVIIIGSGAGGGTLAHTLAGSGKSILLLERGDFLAREMDNWDPRPVFVDGKYISKDTWYDGDGKPFQPQVHYFVGGATKLYGAALYRLRPQDFGEIKHVDGISPAWPLDYGDFEPWYSQAEQLYQVHGNGGEDPTEGHRSEPYPWPAVSHEPRIQQISRWAGQGRLPPVPRPVRDHAERGRPAAQHLHPLHLVRRLPVPGARQIRRRRDRGPAPARPAQRHPGHRGRGDQAGDRRLRAQQSPGSSSPGTASGRSTPATSWLSPPGRPTAPRSCSTRPATSTRQGLANGSDQVGRNYMFHNCKAVVALAKEPNDTVFQKTLGINDFYSATKDYAYPMGNIQMIGKSNAEAMRGEKPKATMISPEWTLSDVAKHAVDFWLTTEDLPKPENRVTTDADGNVHLAYEMTNDDEAFRLYGELRKILNHTGMAEHHVLRKNFYMDMDIPVAGCAHQAGTCRFGTDPATSVLDTNCKAHELDNLYVVDTSFFPSIGAVNPALTAMANALRVGEHLRERLA